MRNVHFNSRSGTKSVSPPFEPESGAGVGFGADSGAGVADAGCPVGVGMGASVAAAPVSYQVGGCGGIILGKPSDNIEHHQPTSLLPQP